MTQPSTAPFVPKLKHKTNYFSKISLEITFWKKTNSRRLFSEQNEQNLFPNKTMNLELLHVCVVGSAHTSDFIKAAAASAAYGCHSLSRDPSR